MSILVTGGAGYIGSHLSQALLDKHESVVVLDNLSTGYAWAVPEGAHFIKGDVRDQSIVSNILNDFNVDAIFHFAGKLLVRESVENPLDYFDSNVAATCNLLNCAVSHGIKHFIFSSSAAIYGTFSDGPVHETQAPRPESPYGRSKLMCEWMLEDAARAHDIRYVSLRYFNVAGADPLGRAGQSSPTVGHLVQVAIQAALGKRSGVSVFGTDYPTPDGTGIRDYVHVTDLAQAHLDALTYLRNGGAAAAFNCGYGAGSSVFDVINAVKSVSGVDFPVHLSGRRLGDPAIVFANADAIKRQLGWKPRHQSLEDMIVHALQWEGIVDTRRLAAKDQKTQSKADPVRLEIAKRAMPAIRNPVHDRQANDALPAKRIKNSGMS